VAYTRAPLTREERAVQAKAGINSSYKNNKQLAFLEFVLGHYVDEGVDELDLDKLTPLLRLKYNAIADAAAELGTVDQIRGLFVGFQKYLYVDTANRD
jgi:type I restriction enzyme R subunit